MDPKFGEISRAMRNRGVEVYIPGEVNGNSFVMEVVLVLTCYTIEYNAYTPLVSNIIYIV